MINTAIIYTRTNSKRLKNKSLLKIYRNKTLIEKVVENTLKIKSIKKIILATTNSKNDKIYKKILEKYNIQYFYGSSNNLIDRTIKCSDQFKFDYFLRVCGDRPFFSHLYIQNLLLKLNRKKNIPYEFVSNNKKNKLVDQGLTVEIISSKSLKNLNQKKIFNNYQLENISSYYYENFNKFNILYVKSPKNWFLKNKYTVDNIQDLIKMKKIIFKVGYHSFNIQKANHFIKKLNYES